MAEVKKDREKTLIFNQLFKKGKWTEARSHILEWLKDEPDHHWLLAQLSEIYFQEYHYEKALEYAEKALQIAPRCPLVLWVYAEALDILKRHDDASKVYKRLIRRGVTRTAYGECGEGIRWARSLVNDCRYKLSIYYAGLGDFRIASKYIKAHIANRNRNCPSVFSLREAKKDLATILEGKNPRGENLQES